jgi:hypothetical protein
MRSLKEWASNTPDWFGTLLTFSRSFASFLASNPHLTLFVLGFAVFCGSLAQWVSGPVAGVVGGVIVMTVAVYPLVTKRG